MRIPPRSILLLSLLAVLPGCDTLDPFRREAAWRPGGVNEANLAAMTAVPAERVQGTGATTAQGHRAMTAIERLRADRVRALPDSGIARIVTVPGGAQGGGN